MSNYEKAILKLNELQSNAAVLQTIQSNKANLNLKSLPEMELLIQQIGYQIKELDELSIIHITGTKGKGSTAAFCESILRHHGYNIGLFTSPHLQEVRERIKLNGIPIPKDKFAKYFFECWDKLEAAKQSLPEPIPISYFRFLTLMAFHVFKSEKVDGVILEVGIGGSYDSTNVIKNPVACGISSIGLDHQAVLGQTISEIAHQKGGILKEGVIAFTQSQKKEALDVLIQRSIELKAPLFITPSLTSYPEFNQNMTLGIAGKHQYENASLALHLSQAFISHKKHVNLQLSPGLKSNEELPFKVTLQDIDLQALKETNWPGRCQIIEKKNSSESIMKYHLDGAHTVESMTACINWFQGLVEEKNNSEKCDQILIFNCTADRNSQTLLSLLQNFAKIHPFQHVFFCHSIPFSSGNSRDLQKASPQENFSFQEQMQKVWETGLEDEKRGEIHIFPSVSDISKWIEHQYQSKNVNILVTGSLHLVGASLTVLGHEVS